MRAGIVGLGIGLVVVELLGSPRDLQARQPLPTITDRLSGMQATIEHLFLSRGVRHTRPSPGNLFLAVDVRVHDGGTRPAQFNEFDFGVRTGPGRRHRPIVASLGLPPLDTGELRQGQSWHGWVIFQIPRMTKSFTVTWDDEMRLHPPARIASYTL